MENSQITLMIEALMEKRKKPAKEISDIDVIIDKLRSQLKSNEFPKATEPVTNDVSIPLQSTPLFPVTASLQAQILAAFDMAKKPLKMGEVAETIQNQTGQLFDVRETVRGMNKNFKLILMKINNSNKLSYWIKPEWYDKESKGIKNEYKLENMDILYDADKIEYIGVKK